jgi:NAD(P)-dependent dehydrogenase (short-subunit alcohol dehydrogenase family)
MTERARFEGRGVVVTGGAQGIGRAIVEGFLSEGAAVLNVDLRESDVGKTLVADLGDPEQAGSVIPTALAELGRVDVLVNCAGVQPDGPALEASIADFDRVFAVNTRGPFILMQDAVRQFVDRGDGSGGAIVNIASANAIRNESPESVYNASKAALIALTTAFAHEFGHLGVRVNCVAPGETITVEAEAGMSDDDREQLRTYLRRVPMRRAGTPAEQAAAVLFLASDDASFITGQTLVVDGGELTGEWYDLRDAPLVPGV